MKEGNGVFTAKGRIETSADGGARGDDHPMLILEKEDEMSGELHQQLQDLKGFTFDGDTGRTLGGLYEAVDTIGGTKDTPFVLPYHLEGHDRPAVVNAYLDPEGRRFHVIWYSDKSGLSHVDDVVLDAPSLATDKHTDSCEACGQGIHGIMEEIRNET